MLIVLGLALAALWVVGSAREIVRTTLERQLAQLLEGRLHVRRIASLSLGGAVLESVTVHDPAGRRVLRAARVEVDYDLLALLRDEIRLTRLAIRNAELKLIPGETTPLSLFDAFLPRSSGGPPAQGSGGPSLHIEGLSLHQARARGDVQGLRGIELVQIDMAARIDVADHFSARVHHLAGSLKAPFRRPIAIEHVTTQVSSKPAVELLVTARASLDQDHVTGRLKLHHEAGKPVRYELLLGLAPLSPLTLRDLELDAAETLITDARGFVRFDGHGDNLTLHAALETAAGQLTVHGEDQPDGRQTLKVQTPHLELAQLLAFAPEVGLSGTLYLDSRPSQPVALNAQLPGLAGFGLAISEVSLRGRYQDNRIDLEETRFAYGGGSFSCDGYVLDSGDFDLHVRSLLANTLREPHLRAEGLRARLATDLRIRYLEDELSAEGRITFDQLSLGELHADSLVVEGKAKGDPFAPTLAVKAQSAGIEVLGRPFGKLRASIRGARRVYTARASLVDPEDRRAELVLALHDEAEGLRFVASSMTLSVPGRAPWQGHGQVTLGKHIIDLRDILLESGAQRLTASGQFSDTRAYRLTAALRSFDLGGLRELSGVAFADLDGIVSGNAVLSGTPGKPRIDARGVLAEGQFLGMTGLGLVVDAVFAEGKFDLSGELTFPDDSRMAITAGGRTGRGRTTLDQVIAGSYDLALDFQQVPLSVAQPWLDWRGMKAPGGSVSALLSGKQTPDGLSLELTTRFSDLQIDPYPAFDIDAMLAHDGKILKVERLLVEDKRGHIAELNGTLATTLPELIDPIALRSELETRPFDLTLTLAPRRLDQFPFEQVGVPLTLSADVKGRQSDQGPILDLTARAHVSGRDLGADCAASSSLELAISGQNQGQAVALQFSAVAAGEPLLSGHASAPLQVGELLAGLVAWRAPQPTWSLELRTDSLEDVPLLCTYGAGPLQASAHGAGLPPHVRDLAFAVRSPALQLRPFVAKRGLRQLRSARLLGRPFRVEASGALEDEWVALAAKLESGVAGRLDVRAGLPARWLRSDAPEARLIELDLEATDFELAELLAALPTSIRASGKLEGRAKVRVELPSGRFNLAGLLDLDHGRLAIPALGQELSDASGRLMLAGDRVHLKNFEARDFDGRLTASGQIRLLSLSHTTMDFDLTAHDFPIRREGAQISKLTGRLGLEADVTDTRTRAQLTLTDLRIDLPSELGQGLQSLSEHPGITIVGLPTRTLPDDPYSYEIRVVSRRPFRVQRSDLTAEVSADLLVSYREPVLSMEGSAELERGSFELYGKRFELGESRMAFDGSLDPLVSLSATHRVGSNDIGVRVDGRLSEPKVSFSHSDPKITNTGEIIAQLVGGRSTATSSSQSQQQTDAAGAAGSFLAGATAGLLTEEVRHELGSNVPVVSVEGGSQSLRGARVRAGVQLDALIEKRLGPLSRVVRGAYVEGFVAPTSSSTTAQAAPQSRGGGLLELRLPADLFGSIEYRPVQNWRLDIAWEP